MFDIAHKDAFSIIKIDEDRQFLTLQRQKGRVGYMTGVDKKLYAVEERRSEREQKRELFKQTSIMQPGKLISLLKKKKKYISDYDNNNLHNILNKFTISIILFVILFFLGQSNTVDFEESISSDDERDVLNSKDSEMCQSFIMPLKNKRCRKEIMTSRLASALDKCKVSDRDAVHLLIACAEVFNVNVNDYAINRSSIKRSRESFRYQISSEIKTHSIN